MLRPLTPLRGEKGGNLMPDQVCAINGLHIAYTDAGRGPALLLFHAFPLSRHMWDPLIPALADRFRIIAPDLPGFGGSEAREEQPSLETYAQDAAALLDTLSIQRAVLGGLSMGGYIALAFYRLFPQRVRALILADTRPQADSPETRQAREQLITLVDTDGTAALADALLPRLLAPESAECNPQLVDQVHAMIEHASILGVIAALRAMMDRPDATTLLPQITCPTLIIVGENDTVTPKADAEVMAARLPRAKLIVIPDAGHLSNLERPDVFNRAVRDFLTELEP